MTTMHTTSPLSSAATPQQARAQQTRAAVLEAAAASLGERGMAGASTSAIAARAGVSQGALFRYFPTKDALLSEAVAHVLAELAERFATSWSSPAPASEGGVLRAGVGLLWEIFTDARLYGVFEVFLAARTNPELGARLSPIIEAHARAELAIARALFPRAARENARFDDIVRSVLTMLQGAAIASAAQGGAGDAPLELRFIEELIRAELGEPEINAEGEEGSHG